MPTPARVPTPATARPPDASLDRADGSVIAVRIAPGLWPYIQIARIDHWFKNAFMLLGVLFAFFYVPEKLSWLALPLIASALIATCLVASSNYVLNELLDGSRDALHPLKRHRPVPAGLIARPIAYAEWLVLGAIGLGIATLIGPTFAASAAALWIMGVLYNVPPIRLKEWPYLDVLSESLNNPIRLLLGWFALVTSRIPPISLVLAYWMVGAFFMGAKRLAEYRHLAEPVVAAQYRSSFRHYTEDRLIVSIFFYATASALFAGVFIVRYHAELILFAPVAAALFAYYLRLALKPDSPAQRPEKLYKERRFLLYAALSVALFFLLLFVRIPAIYDLFNIEATADRVAPLWVIGGER
jgi:4-hydroxybenzoate polyprenyltransferase